MCFFLFEDVRNDVGTPRKNYFSLIGHLYYAMKVVWPGRTFFATHDGIVLFCCFWNHLSTPSIF